MRGKAEKRKGSGGVKRERKKEKEDSRKGLEIRQLWV